MTDFFRDLKEGLQLAIEHRKVSEKKGSSAADAELEKIGAFIRMNEEKFPFYSPEEIQNLRFRMGVSQTGLARFLGVDIALVKNWELGIEIPEKVVMRLLQVLDDTKYYKNSDNSRY